MKAHIYGVEEDESPDGMYRVEFEENGEVRAAVDFAADELPSLDEPQELAFLLHEVADQFELLARAEIADDA